MADLSLIEVFGTNAIYDDDAGTITFSLIGLENLDIYNPPVTQENINQFSSKILWAILSRIYDNQPENNNDDSRLIYISNQGKRTAARNNVAQFSFALVANGYVNDPFGTELDPNNLGGSNSEAEGEAF